MIRWYSQTRLILDINEASVFVSRCFLKKILRFRKTIFCNLLLTYKFDFTFTILKPSK